MRARVVAPERCEPSPAEARFRHPPPVVGVAVGDGLGEVGVGVGVGWFFTTFRMMVVLVGTVVPGCGLWLTTVPSGIPGLDTSSIWTWLKPCAARAALAASTCWLITLGTGAPPGETKIVTVAPWAASVPACGSWRTTVFGGAVEFWSVRSWT